MSSSMSGGKNRRLSAALALLMTGTFLATAAPAASGATAESPWWESPAVTWNQHTFDAVVAGTATGVTTPPIGGRIFAIVSSCVYDAWSAYDATAVGTRFGGTLRRPSTERNWKNKYATISYAAHRALVNLYPAQKANLDAKLAAQGYDPANTEINTTTPAGIAHKACDAVLQYRLNDGANQANNYADPTPDSYQPVNPYMDFENFDKTQIVDPGKWAPIRQGGVVPKFAGEHFADMTPFAMQSAAQFLPPAPPAWGTAQAQAELNEVMNYSATLTDKQKVIAEFWIEPAETPTGHQNQWAQFVSARDGQTVDEDVKMFFGLNLGMGDASAAIRYSKRNYDKARPISMIRYEKAGQPMQAWVNGQGTQTIDGKDWKPYLKTPSFPAYISGHSAWGSVAGEYLKLWTGSDYYGDQITFKAGTSKIEAGTPKTDVTLAWNTFSQAAVEDGMSRLYGGVHVRADMEAGRQMGINIANNAYNVANNYFNGIAPTQ